MVFVVFLDVLVKVQQTINYLVRLVCHLIVMEIFMSPINLIIEYKRSLYQRNLIVSMKIVRFSRNQHLNSHFLLLTNDCFA